MTSETWRERAACLGAPTELFFPKPGEHELTDMAFSFCRKCPVIAECADYAKQVGARHGIWGGESAYKRTRIRNRTLEVKERRKAITAAERQWVAELIAAGWIDSAIAKETGINVRTVYRVRESVTPEHERATA